MVKLKETGVITNNMFAFYLSKKENVSSVQIGGYDSTKIKSGASITWMNLP